MPKFITIGYGDRAGYDRISPEVLEQAHAADAEMEAKGALIGVAGVPVQVRNPEARGVSTSDGPFMRTDLPLAGFAILEAADLQEAIALVAQSPCAVAHGVVEVWPLLEP